ncbi:uncharacterized protein LOC119584562 [Penaeus monodon]|uniref:uncharacterized protein LOC119584562 n=1 Tax=Penaeus monodon TaxID=6687 RepID=UPI0018A71E72|nr:uncharacterized protein LOC119584562 [Penaeus monodon]XP_037789173.1 uncharacterized protein LOC119584562 [Penaeus monodon]XP_037789174.1 uncharacterized protein LOC119584562 [Penaeus monodon]XP_037789175.1 uncharacterized protein LOC119584562 [Penaeus monodon]
MLAVAVVNNHEGGVGSGCGRPADDEDLLLTRLRQMQNTLRECHWRLDRTDRWAESLFLKGEKEGAGKDLSAPHLNGKEDPLECDPCFKGGDMLVGVCDDKKPRQKGLVVREGVCKESIIESEVVEELVLRKEWEYGFDDYDDLLIKDINQREVEDTKDAAKEGKDLSTTKPRLERQNSLDVEDDHLPAHPPKSGSNDQCVEDAKVNGIQGMPTADQESSSLPRDFDENEMLRFLNANQVPCECEIETKPSKTPGLNWRKFKGDMRQANILEESFDFSLGIALFKHLDYVEETLENLRLQFFTLKHAITHNTPEDPEFDLVFPDLWMPTDRKEPETQESESRRKPRHQDPTGKTVSEDPADKEESEHLKPEAQTVPEPQNRNEFSCSTNNKSELAEAKDEENMCANSATQEKTPSSVSAEEDLEGTTSNVAEDKEKKQIVLVDARRYEDFQRCLMTVLVVFFLLLVLLLLACYLLVVVPFVTVSYRHAEGTAVF